jgi:hypothetical protein
MTTHITADNAKLVQKRVELALELLTSLMMTRLMSAVRLKWMPENRIASRINKFVFLRIRAPVELSTTQQWKRATLTAARARSW